MQIQALGAFRAVARHGSVTAAAGELRYTQSAVSRQIAALEAELGVTLFDRRPRGVTLTAAGRALLPHADAMLDRLATAYDELDALRGLGAGRLRVGAFPTAVADLVPRALAGFRAAHPRVRLRLLEGRTPALLERVLAGDADVAVVSSPPDAPPDADRFALRHLLDERLLVAVGQGHRLAGRDVVRLAELADEAFVPGSPDQDDPLMRAAMPAGFRPQVDIVAADWTGKLGCVAAGLGVALVPALATRAARPDIALLRLHPDDAPVRRIFAVTAAALTPVPAAQRFVAELATAAAAF